MKHLLTLISLLVACASTASAQTSVASTAAQRDAANARGLELKSQRDTLEAGYRQQLKQCYQMFDVTRCRNEAREQYTVAHRALSKLENEHAGQVRHLDAQDARQRLMDRQADATQRAQEAERAQQQSQDRALRNADKQNDHAPESSKRSQFDEKQRDAQERRLEVERRAREREKPRAAGLPAPGAKP